MKNPKLLPSMTRSARNVFIVWIMLTVVVLIIFLFNVVSEDKYGIGVPGLDLSSFLAMAIPGELIYLGAIYFLLKSAVGLFDKKYYGTNAKENKLLHVARLLILVMSLVVTGFGTWFCLVALGVGVN
jgi:hypothetical protein